MLRSQLLSLLLVAAPMALFAAGKADPVFHDRKGVAISGYDAVSYFDGTPMPGKTEFTHSWMGVTFLFANAANRDKFAAAPERFAPQFGGYCAWAVGHGYTAKTDPLAWKVVNGKLYLNYDKSVQQMWEKDQAGWIAKGEQNWPNLRK